MVRIYPLETCSTYFQKIIGNSPVRAFHYQSTEGENKTILQFLIVVTLGKDYPREKLLLIALRKNASSYIIDPAACVFDGKSFFELSGLEYDSQNKTFDWDQGMRTEFIKYLKYQNEEK